MISKHINLLSKMQRTIFLLLLPAILKCQLYDQGVYYTGSNLVQNPSFTSPVLPAGSFDVLYPTSIPGWNCTVNCQLKDMPLYCASRATTCNINYTQAIDLDSNGQFENVSQLVNIPNQGSYLLRVEWIPALVNPLGKSFSVHANSTTVININAGNNNFSTQVSQIVITLPQGLTLISMKPFGYVSDSVGVHVNHVSLKELILIQNQAFSQNVHSIIFNNFTSSVNLVPGSRIFAYTLTNYMTSFDRLQFYFYHQQNLSYYSEILLSNVNSLALERGSVLQKLFEYCNDTAPCYAINRAYSNLLQAVDQEYNYTSPEFLSKNPKGRGFFANNLDFFVYELPGIIAIYIILSLVFRMLFNHKISKFIRKYSFYGILLLVIYEGNVEQFSFYFFTECRNLFSINFKHKLVRTFMLLFFWLLLVFTVGGLVWFKFHYKKLVKYFLEDSKTTSLKAIMLQSFERSVFPLLFGSIHSLLIDNLTIQTIVLGIIEVCYFAVKLYSLRTVILKYKFKIAMMSLTSLLRMVLIITLYLYQRAGNPTIINLIHHDIVWLYLICWIAQSFYDFGIFIGDLIEAIKILSEKSDDSKKKEENKNKKKKEKEKDKQNKSSEKNKQGSILKQRRKSKSKSKDKEKSLKNKDLGSKTMKEIPGKKEEKSLSKNKKIKSQKREPQLKIIKTTFQIEMPDKTKTPEVVFYRAVSQEKNMGFPTHK